jgi:hypothetical protein
MAWEQRLREMIVAGGALAATACGGATGAQSGANPDATANQGEFCCNANGDPCCPMSCGSGGVNAPSYVACEQSETECSDKQGRFAVDTEGTTACAPPPAPADGSVDSGPPVTETSGCCNANPDPCCPILCGDEDPDAAPYVACEQDEAECKAMHGVFEYGSRVCTGADASVPPPDAGPVDAGPSDAEPDQMSFFSCCNANSDPCCPIGFCAGGVGADGAAYIDCEQNRTQCESMDGDRYAYEPDGSLGCAPRAAPGH